jgi:PAS domain S-box-containing protein
MAAKQTKKIKANIVEDSQVFIDNLVEYAPYPLFVINPDTSIRYANPAFEELTGFKREELHGCKPPYPWWLGDIDKKTKDLKTLVLTGDTKIERCNIKKNGERFWVQISGKPIFVDGKLKYFLSNWVDITERKKTVKQLSDLNIELRNLTAHLDSVREEERGHISRMLHDEIGQALTALKMDVCWIRKNIKGKPETASEVADSMLKLIDDTFRKVRWISTVLRPIWLNDLGLPDTLKWLVTEFHEMTRIKCTLDIDDVSPNTTISTGIYRIFQEALNNIFRHSKATAITVKLKKIKSKLVLTVIDNGVGITESQISNPKSYGIIGMRERAQFLNGTFNISKNKKTGTTVEVTIPIKKGAG